MSGEVGAEITARLAQRAEREKAVEQDWAEAVKPAKASGQQVRVLGANPQDAVALPNTSPGGASVPVREVPGGAIVDGLPRVENPPLEVQAQRVRLDSALILRERFPMVLPPAPAPNIPANGLDDFRYWFYRNDGGQPVELPLVRDWQFVQEDVIVTPSASSNIRTLASYGVTVGGYGIYPATVWLWQKFWDSPNPEPATWTQGIDLAVGTNQQASLVLAGAYNPSPNTRNERIRIYIRDGNGVALSLNRKSIYIQHYVTGWNVNNRHGLYYYQLPRAAKTLSPAPIRFAASPSFTGADDDWLKDYPNQVNPPPNLCYSNDYAVLGSNYSGAVRYWIYLADIPDNPAQPQSVPVQKNRVITNDSIACTLSDPQSLRYQYRAPDMTAIPSGAESLEVEALAVAEV